MNATPVNRENMAEIAPKLALLSEEILFGDIWQRDVLSPRDRSLITVSTLIALSRNEQLGWHLELARKNGISDDEITEAITHLAFYCGWPNAVSALTVFKNSLLD